MITVEWRWNALGAFIIIATNYNVSVFVAIHRPTRDFTTSEIKWKLSRKWDQFDRVTKQTKEEHVSHPLLMHRSSKAEMLFAMQFESS